MKKIILIILLFFAMSTTYYLIGIYEKNLQKNQYNPPICGDNICKSSEESYCLDCNLSCKSEFCNSEINILCNNCSTIQKEFFLILLEHQTIAYNCLSDLYGYHPPRLVYHTISITNTINKTCSNKEGCYIGGGGFSEEKGIMQDFIPGLIKYGETEVTKKENVGFEIHELAHAFTYYNLGPVPSWFSEGISIYSESRLLCPPNYNSYDRIGEFLSLYSNSLIKNGTSKETISEYEYNKTKQNIHVVGSLYFGLLERDYDCDKECVSKILYSLYEYRENCTGSCFENAKKFSPQLMNLSLNNKDLRIPIITNKIIKQKSEEITQKDLTSLFELLEIEY